MTRILRDPAAVLRVRESGWSGTHHTDPTTGERIVGTPEGLGFGVDEAWHSPREVIAWSDVERSPRPSWPRFPGQLVEFGKRMSEHHKKYRGSRPARRQSGVGRSARANPLTVRQEAYVHELEAFEASGVQAAWEAKKAAHADARWG
ncbi:hypothetical protein JCM18899A_39320 [Nocardioides sp. AN3]